MFDIVVAVNDEEIFKNNLLRSLLLNKVGVTLQIQRGYSSAGTAYNSAINNCKNDFVIFAHQDVYIPTGWEEKVIANISYLDRIDPDWAVLGVYGVDKFGQHKGYVWSSGLNKILGSAFEYPIPVGSIDELLIILKKSTEISFDEKLPGYHLFGTDLVQTACLNKKSAYVICAPVIHNSRPILYLANDYFAAYDYLVKKWNESLPIPTCVLPIVGSIILHLKTKFKQYISKFRYFRVDRSKLDRGYDCIELAKKLSFECDSFS